MTRHDWHAPYRDPQHRECRRCGREDVWDRDEDGFTIDVPGDGSCEVAR